MRSCLTERTGADKISLSPRTVDLVLFVEIDCDRLIMYFTAFGALNSEAVFEGFGDRVLGHQIGHVVQLS